jgi:hypothetical protein
MKKLVFLSVIMGFAISNIQAQLEMSTTGQFSVAASPAPNAWTEFGISFAPTTANSNSQNYSLNVSNNFTLAYYTYGIYAQCYSSTSVGGRAYGIQGMAGNSTSGYNYGVYGVTSGSQYGAGIFGAQSGRGDYYVPGTLAGFFNGSVTIGTTSSDILKVYTTTYTSDKRLKKNITPLTNTLFNKISKLNSVQFQFKTRQELRADGTIAPDTSKNDTINGIYISRIHYGYIAQDLQKIFPELVYQGNDGFLSVDYVSLIPLMMGAIKQQDSIITSLQQQVNNCCNKGSIEKTHDQNGNADQTGINDNNNGVATPALFQNNPNPFSQQTQIKCIIPDNAIVSAIYIYDMQGTQIRKIQINGKGNQNIIIQGSELKAGMYMYSLIIDGKVIDTKKMVLTD